MKNTYIYDKKIVEHTQEYVKRNLVGDQSHDWWHTYRVWKIAGHIAKREQAELLIVELAALLHDISDWKFNNGNASIGSTLAEQWLKNNLVDQKIIDQVSSIIYSISFKGANVPEQVLTLEGKIVQDADRLDAIGAIGIARTFTYGGFKNREIYNPNISPKLHDCFESYKTHEGTTINHFYEKLLLIRDRMQTQTGKILAEKRHKFMEDFLSQFYSELSMESLD